MYLFSVPPCFYILKLETCQICSGKWLSVVDVATYINTGKYLEVYVALYAAQAAELRMLTCTSGFGWAF